MSAPNSPVATEILDRGASSTASLELSQIQARPLLAPHVASGRQLIVAAAMIGDEDDFGVWSWRCKDWSTQLGGALRYIYGSEDGKTFERAIRASRSVTDWQTAVREELERVQSTLEMLSELSEGLREDVPGLPDEAAAE